MKKFLALFVLLAFMAGCNVESESAPPALPQYDVESKNTTTTEQTTVSEPEPKNKNGFYPVEREKYPDSLDDEDSRYDESFTGFSGIELLSETPKLGNSHQNLTGYASYYGIVCADGDVDTQRIL